MLPGVMPFVLTWIPHRDPLRPAGQGVLLAVTGVLLLLFLGSRRWISRQGEQDLAGRALGYAVIVVGLILLFPGQMEFAAAVVVVLAFGDGAAALAGKAFGTAVLPWNPSKTWVGTICFLLASAPLATLAYWIEARPPVSLPVAVLCGTAPALAGCVAESLCQKVPDNLPTGLAASAGIVGVHVLVATCSL